MESPRKFNDCYFYYYSTCTKGDNCVFRHEPSALGCETMCSAWQQGKCLDKRCKLRHMELRKNRKQIPCYWENQPGGCRKMHCPFMHKNPDARTDGIAPSKPQLHQPVVSAHPGSEGIPAGVAGVPAGCGPDALPAPPPPLPMLWQHQQPRQVVLDSAILGVLPGGGELVARRGVHEAAAYAALAPAQIDPLVVNFEEESDNESAPSSTPTKHASPEEEPERGCTSELALLARIQAEAAAYYRYDDAHLPPRQAKYDRLSLDEIAGNKLPPAERRKSLDFKVLSLDEIRARKKADAIVQSAPITLNLSRKRKLSTQETVTSTGNKIIKVIRSNSIVYKKVDPEAPPPAVEATKTSQKQNENVEPRKRTLSEQTADIYNMQDDELLDDCHDFKRIKLTQSISKPRLIRNRHISIEKASQLNDVDDSNKTDNDSDSEVQIVSVDITENTILDLSDTEIIEVDSTRVEEPIAIVDLSDDDDVTITENDFPKNVPDVVASCRKKNDSAEKDVLKDIDSILNDNNDAAHEEL